MQLDQPIPPTYPGGGNQYDFILNGNQKPKKSLVPKPRSLRHRLMLIAGGALAVVIVLTILSLLLGNKGGSTQSMLTVAQTQTEIIRVSSAGSNQAHDLSLQGFAENVVLSLTTSQQQTVKYLSGHGHKADAKELALGKNSQTDIALKTASEAGRYDAQLNSIIKQELTDYQAQLNQVAKTASSSAQKQLLQQLYDQATTLLKNQPATSS